MYILYVYIMSIRYISLNIIAVLTFNLLLLISSIFPVALLYSAFGVIIEKTRGAEDDLNTIAAGTMTGMLYKCTGRYY